MNRLLLLALVALVAGAVGWGFWTVGGPVTARMEKQDRERLRDLRDWGRYYSCQVAEGAELPDDCAGQTRAPDSTDPATGAAYRYTLLDETTFEVCAVFQAAITRDTPDYRTRNLFFDGDEGCLRYKRANAASDWVLQ